MSPTRTRLNAGEVGANWRRRRSIDPGVGATSPPHRMAPPCSGRRTLVLKNGEGPMNSDGERSTMSYHSTTTTHGEFDDALTAVTRALAEEGVGILTEMDLRAALAKKLNFELRPYKILGACDPDFALAEIAREVRTRLQKVRRPWPKRAAAPLRYRRGGEPS